MSRKRSDRKEAALRIVYLRPAQLKPYPKNARRHSPAQIRQIAQSIQKFGFTNPVLVADDNKILAGHGRVEAAKQLNIPLIPTVELSSLTPLESRAYILADNRLAECATWDRETLAVEIQDLVDLGLDEIEVTGFSLADIDMRLDEANEKAGKLSGPDDEIPPRQKRVVCQAGDLWILGQHRLLCGDATVAADYQRVMERKHADLILTDPPYNLPTAYISGLGRHRHANFAVAHGEKSSDEFSEFLSTFLKHAKRNATQGAIMFVFMDWRHLFELLSSARDQSLPLKNLIVWAKSNGGMGSFYRSQHELIAVFKNGDRPHVNTFELGQNGRYRTNVWNYPGGNSFHEQRSAELAMHPTVKPVALLADAIKDVTRRGGIVVDPFLGSGSTLIAAEKTGRRACGLEIDPGYCDVIIRRFQTYTGKSACLAGTSMTFEDVDNTRRRR